MNLARRVLLPVVLTLATVGASQAQTMNTPDTPTNHTDVATFGGGCFWCLEALFQTVDGVKSITSGFAGGVTKNPSYKEVCTGRTGHAEVVQIEFDPQKISYAKLLDLFWDTHDPTTLNRQGNDVGTQYRSIILFRDEAQRRAAVQSKAQAAKRFSRPIVTQIEPLTAFYKAEDYHQDYFRQHAGAPYCRLVIRPKLSKFEAEHGNH